MKPLTNGATQNGNGKAATNKKGGKAGKAKASASSKVKKAKASAVKKVKAVSRVTKEDAQDLLDGSVNNGHVTLTPTASGAGVKKRVQKVKSIVNMANGHKRFENSPSVTPSARRSSRRTRASAAANGSPEVEMGVEVTEANAAALQNGSSQENGGGFLKKTISAIWQAPANSLARANSYSSMDNGGGDAQQKQEAAAAGRSSCVIS